MAKTCYMCENKSTSKEHVPPKCLFPKKQDLPNNMDFRKDLITVPSCDIHNSQKSKDDEYLFYCLAISILSNEHGQNQFATKIRRAISRNPSLIKQFISKSTSVIVEDSNGFRYSSMGIFINRERLDRILKHIGYALYYFITGLKWDKNVFVHPEFLMYLNGEDDIKANNSLSSFSSDLDEIFSQLEYHGNNQEIFKYQYLKYQEDFTLRLYFYGESKATIFLTNRDLANNT